MVVMVMVVEAEDGMVEKIYESKCISICFGFGVLFL